MFVNEVVAYMYIKRQVWKWVASIPGVFVLLAYYFDFACWT